MARLIKRERGNYTNVSNVLVRDTRLSWKARGIFIYLWSQSNEWQFYVNEVAKHATDGRDALRSGLKELEQYGYLERRPLHEGEGKFDGMGWVLSDIPNHCTENPDDGENRNESEKSVEKPSDGKPVERESRRTENPTLRNNNNKNYQSKEVPNKEINSASPEKGNAEHVSDLEKDFEEIWELYPSKKNKKAAFSHYKQWRKKSVKHTNEYLKKRLDIYLQYCQQNRSWYHPMNGSTWFNGRFDDDYQVNMPNRMPQSGGYDTASTDLSNIDDDSLPF